MKLTGIRVLDLSQFLPGPHLTMTMADHGADVIMVEPKNGVGEPVRAMGARAPDGTAVWFRNIARGKRSIALDLKSKDDLAMFLKLADEADVIVEAFRPGVVARLGIGYDAIAARNPRIVYCSISAFGQNGPLRDKPSHDLGVQALAGTLELSRGYVDDKPNMPNLVAADMASSLTALSAILMALLARERSDKGEYIDIAMYDLLIAWTPNVVGSVFGEGRAPVPHQMRNYGGQAMNRIYETSDGGFIVLAGSEAKFSENSEGSWAPRFSRHRQGRAGAVSATSDRVLHPDIQIPDACGVGELPGADRSVLGAGPYLEGRVRRRECGGAFHAAARREPQSPHWSGDQVPQRACRTEIRSAAL